MTKQTYTEMVDSGIKWIGKIPKGWEVMKIGHQFFMMGGFPFKSEDYVDDGIPVIKMSEIDSGKIDISNANFVLGNEEYDFYSLKDGDLIIGLSGSLENFAMIKQSDEPCYLNQRVGKFTSKIGHTRFLFYVIQSKAYKEQIYLTATGTAQLNISNKQVCDLKFSFPPLPTQQAIASYLDSKTAQIDEAISLKTQQIALLREKRTALINHIVTKGLDSDVELVDSGIEWIGKIPKGWEVRKIRSLLMKKEIEYQDGNHGELHPKSEDYEDEGIPFIMASDVRDNKINFKNCKKIPKHITDKLRIGYSHTGDVLFTHKGTIGEVAIVPQLNSDYIMLTPQVTYYRILNNQLLNNKYLAAFFSAPIFKNQLDLICSMQSTRDYIGLIAQKNLIIVIPSITEQEKISSYLDNETVQIDNTISHIQQSIDLLMEYKQSLISHVVTGKVKVG